MDSKGHVGAVTGLKFLLSIGRSLFALMFLAVIGSPAEAARIDRIRERGHLTCGIVSRISGFTHIDAEGKVWGFEPDLCRAIAAAIFGSGDKVDFVGAASLDDFKRDGSIDVVARRLTVTLQRQTDQDLEFSPIVFYDGTAFLIPADSQRKTLGDLTGQRVCVTTGSEAATALAVFTQRTRLNFQLTLAATLHQAADGLFTHRCDALAADLSQIAAERSEHPLGVAEYDIMPEVISKEPLALLLHRDNDNGFAHIVAWTIFALIEAEELDIRSSNVTEKRLSHDPDVAAFMGTVPGNGRALGLTETWAADIVQEVGNYGELYDRNLGMKSPLKLSRGFNALWTSGGLLYAPPMR